MRTSDVRASRVALIADAIVNRDLPGSGAAVDALVVAGFGFLILPPHGASLPSTPRVIEYLLDDAVDYRRNGYEVVVVSAAALPQRGVWADLVTADLARRGAPGFPEHDVTALPAELLTSRAAGPPGS